MLTLIISGSGIGLDRLESEFSINVYAVTTAICLLSESIAPLKNRRLGYFHRVEYN